MKAILDELSEAPYVGRGIKALQRKYPQRYHEALERHLKALERYYNGDTKRIELACDAFLEMTFETLRMQDRFFRTGQFSLPSEERALIHQDEQRMAGPYLTGLFLSAVFWENHFEKMLYFEDVFAPKLPQCPSVLDVGPGSGLYCALTRLHRPKAQVTVNDISAYSKPMVEKICFIQEKDDPINFILGEFPNSIDEVNHQFDAIIFSDVVEHLPDPEAGMAAINRLLAPGGVVFFSTATNAAFWDHTVVFDDVNQIDRLIHDHGFVVDNSTKITVFENSDGRKVVDYLAVLRTGETKT